MAKLKIKRAVSFVMATVLSLTAFMGVGANTAFAAAGEKTNVYMVDFPRDGDANYDGVWGHNNLTCACIERASPIRKSLTSWVSPKTAFAGTWMIWWKRAALKAENRWLQPPLKTSSW